MIRIPTRDLGISTSGRTVFDLNVVTHTEGTRLPTREQMCDSFGGTGRTPTKSTMQHLAKSSSSFQREFFDGVRSSNEEELKGVCESSSVLWRQTVQVSVNCVYRSTPRSTEVAWNDSTWLEWCMKTVVHTVRRTDQQRRWEAVEGREDATAETR